MEIRELIESEWDEEGIQRFVTLDDPQAPKCAKANIERLFPEVFEMLKVLLYHGEDLQKYVAHLKEELDKMVAELTQAEA